MHTSIISLQSQLEQAKERLKGVEEDIKKNTGRDLSTRAFKRQVRTDDGPPAKRRLSDIKGRLGDWVDRPRGQMRPLFQRNANDRIRDGGDRIPAKKRLGDIDSGNNQAVTVFSRLSGPPKAVDNEDKDKVKMTSQVLVQETPSRREILAAQNVDTSCKERNRRMFGALMGTLQKFRQEENKLKEKEEKKAEVERRVEEAAEREREAAKKQRLELFSTRRQQQSHIRHIEFKIIRLKQLAEWEENKRRLLPFIATTVSPKIFYLPKKHNEKTSALLKAHQDTVNKEIEKKRAEVEKLIEDSASRAEEGDEQPMEKDETDDEEDENDNGRKPESDTERIQPPAPKRRVVLLKKNKDEDKDKDSSSESSSDHDSSSSESSSDSEDSDKEDKKRSKSTVKVKEEKDKPEEVKSEVKEVIKARLELIEIPEVKREEEEKEKSPEK